MLLVNLCLVVIGILFIYSSGITSAGVNVSNEYLKQIFWFALGIIVLFFLLFFDYDKLKNISQYLYFFFLFILVLTLLFGKVVNGAKSWVGFMSLGIQPSEFAKLATILYLATYMSNNTGKIKNVKTLLSAFMITSSPMLLILIQPDMGTALVFLPIFFFVSFLAGARFHHLFFIFAIGLITIFLGVSPVWFRMTSTEMPVILNVIINMKLFMILQLTLGALLIICLFGFFLLKHKLFYWFAYVIVIVMISLFGSLAIQKVLKDYQVQRLIVFLDPEVDRLGAGWNIIQSVTAVGSGGLTGKGFLKGTQSHYRFLPQQSTDFIFSILSEEWGFVGGIIVFILIMIILFRAIYIARNAKDKFGAFIAIGIMGMIFFHAMINIGMTIGVMPITGIPLIFVSYGGSSLLTGFIAVGLLLSIHNRRYR